jgi:hypothetical protein
VQSVSEHGFHFEGILVNRRLEHLGLCPETPPAGAPQHLVHAFAVISALQQRESLAMVDLIENIRKSLDMRTDRTIPKCLSLPELARDVHSLSDLHEISLALERFNPA